MKNEIKALLRDSGMDQGESKNNGNGIVHKDQRYLYRQRFSTPTSDLINLEIVGEEHHFYYGQPWSKGLTTLGMMKELGLETCSKVLEFGCGSLRNGIHLIRFLDKGNYYGSDIDVNSIYAGISYEMSMHHLFDKKPVIKLDGNFGISFIDKKVDFVLATSVFKPHLSVELLTQAFQNSWNILEPSGKLIIAGNNVTQCIPKDKFHMINKLQYKDMWGSWKVWVFQKMHPKR